MKKQLAILGAAIVVVMIAGGLLLHALTSRWLAATSLAPVPETPRPVFGDRTMNAETNPNRPPGPPQPHADPLAQNLFPPELIMQFQDRIGLSIDQRQAILTDMQQAQPKFEKLQQQLQHEQAALGLLLEKERVELEPTLIQSDRVQQVEREMRHTQLAILIGLKNRLTSEQQAMLQEIKADQSPGEGLGAAPPRALQEKMQRLQTGLEQWQRNGLDPSPIGRAMQEFHPLIEAGQFKEAEAVLDDALRRLADGNEPK